MECVYTTSTLYDVLGRWFVPLSSSFAVKSLGLEVRKLKIQSLGFRVRELSLTPNPKLLTAKLEGTGTNQRPRIRPQLYKKAYLKKV